MRRLSALAAMCRAAGGKSSNYRIVQASLYSTGGIADARSRWFSCNKLEDQSSSTAARAVAGAMLFSVAATALADVVHAKEPINPKFRPNDVVLYQYEACPFCNKVKAFLDYCDIPYKIVEVNPISKNEIKWSDYKKVPILMVDGEQLVDSSDIIDKLSQKVRPETIAKPTLDAEEENKWRKWVDNHLVHILSPNIYRSASEALESFDYITSKALYEAAETWVDALNGRDFLGGSKPNLADLAVFGVLRPIRYLKSGQDMVENTRIGDWYSRMERAVGEPHIILA